MDDDVLRVYLYRLKDLDKVRTKDTINTVEKVPWSLFHPFLVQDGET